MRTKAVMETEVPVQWSPEMASAMNIDAKDIVVEGDRACSTGVYTLDYSDADGEPAQVDGRFATVLKRQDDGGWANYRDIFSSNT